MRIPNTGKTRSFLYKSAKVLGDNNAVKHGNMSHRLAKRVFGKVTSRLLSNFSDDFKSILLRLCQYEVVCARTQKALTQIFFYSHTCDFKLI